MSSKPMDPIKASMVIYFDYNALRSSTVTIEVKLNPNGMPWLNNVAWNVGVQRRMWRYISVELSAHRPTSFSYEI